MLSACANHLLKMSSKLCLSAIETLNGEPATYIVGEGTGTSRRSDRDPDEPEEAVFIDGSESVEEISISGDTSVPPSIEATREVVGRAFEFEFVGLSDKDINGLWRDEPAVRIVTQAKGSGKMLRGISGRKEGNGGAKGRRHTPCSLRGLNSSCCPSHSHIVAEICTT